MSRLVVIAPILLQHAANRHRACNEQKVCGQNYQNHSHEEHRHGAEGLLDGHGQIIRHRQQDQPQNRQHPVGPGRLFAGAFAAQQIHGAGRANLQKRFDQQKHVDDAEHRRREKHGPGRYRKVEGNIAVHDVHQQQLRQFGNRHARCQADRHRARQHQQRFPEEHPGNITLAHAQHVIQAEFPLPATNQEGIGVQKEDGAENPHNPAAQGKHGLHLFPAPDTRQHGGILQIADDVKHHDHARAGEQIGHVQPCVFANTVYRQFCVKAHPHCASPPDCSMVKVAVIF